MKNNKVLRISPDTFSRDHHKRANCEPTQTFLPSESESQHLSRSESLLMAVSSAIGPIWYLHDEDATHYDLFRWFRRNECTSKRTQSGEEHERISREKSSHSPADGHFSASHAPPSGTIQAIWQLQRQSI